MGFRQHPVTRRTVAARRLVADATVVTRRVINRGTAMPVTSSVKDAVDRVTSPKTAMANATVVEDIAIANTSRAMVTEIVQAVATATTESVIKAVTVQ